jgi:methionine-rich copper-binding protein CopC
MKSAVQLTVALAVLALAGAAFAHAFLDRATPAVGSTVHGPPAEVKLWFTQALEPAFSTLRVVDKSGKQVDRKDKQVDRGDARLLRVSLPSLAPGTYRVLWRVLSVDTHVSEGDFTFDVAP